jgi:hypothetical protein
MPSAAASADLRIFKFPAAAFTAGKSMNPTLRKSASF